MVLTIDSSTSVKNLGVVASLVLTPKPIFISMHQVLETPKDSKFYVNEYKKMISAVGAIKVVGTVNDNEQVMKSAQRELKEEFPWLINVGCVSHILNLFAKNGLQVSTSISSVMNLVQFTTKTIKKSSSLNGTFVSIQGKLQNARSSRHVSLHNPGEYRSS